MVNPDCFLTREQSKPTSIRVTFQVVFGNGKKCILHKYLYFITHCSNCIHNHGTIRGDSPCAIFSAAVGATGHYPSLASINCLLNNFYSAPTPTAEVKSFQERPWQSHRWNCLSSMQLPYSPFDKGKGSINVSITEGPVVFSLNLLSTIFSRKGKQHIVTCPDKEDQPQTFHSLK